MRRLLEVGKQLVRPTRDAAFQRWPALRMIKRYREVIGRYPNLIQPRSFSEKVLCKMFFDRDPMLSIYADKYCVRDFVAERLQDERLLTHLYHVVSNAADIVDLDLPRSFVMKANHLSGQVEIVRDVAAVDRNKLVQVAGEWLRRNYYESYAEWAYRSIEPCVLFEEMLGIDCEMLVDYKFYCFDGEPQFISVHHRRGVAHCRNFYDPSWNKLPFKVTCDNIVETVAAPAELPQMLEIAAALSRGIDFIRVDLYNIAGRIIFGELTNYPGASLFRFEPAAWDLKMGACWQTLGWKK